jgi:arabinofuranan 3-O-arabinosyltransferase
VLAALLVAVFKLWSSEAGFALKTAVLFTGALIVTPCLYMYDLIVLAVPAAYLIHIGLRRGFSCAKIIGLPAAGLLQLAYPYLKTQIVLAAALIAAGLVAARDDAADARRGC